jgi:hypothetical protein
MKLMKTLKMIFIHFYFFLLFLDFMVILKIGIFDEFSVLTAGRIKEAFK